MFFKILKINFIILFFSFVSFAEIVNKIQIEGNKRISSETIQVLGSISKDIDMNNEILNNILKSLYETNFFSDVSVKLENNTLIINVKERPVIQTITINGIKKESLKEIIQENLVLKEKNSFIESTFKSNLQDIKNSLKNNGYYFVDIDTSIIRNDNNTIDLVYDFDLGKKAHIGKISFIGNKVFKDKKLRNLIVSEESKFWKFISNKKYLNQSNIAFDKRLLLNFYRNEGYYQANIIDGYAKYLDSNQFEVVYNIEAGDKYYFNEFTFNLPSDFDKKNFVGILKLFKDLKGEKYSINRIEKILNEIDKITELDQYEFINADISEKIIDKNKLNFVINIAETKKVYVEKINIFGNNITQEKFIRNQLIVDEGDPLNKILQTRSINKLRGTNIFESVSYKVKEGSNNNKKIIDINVVEKSTGEIFAGAGVGTSGGTVSFGIKENNYLGTGTKLDTSLALGADTFTGLLSIRRPNFRYSDNSLNTVFESSKTDKLTNFGYDNRKNGFEIGTSYEQYKNFYFTPAISTYHEKLTTNNIASANLKKQTGNYFNVNFNYSTVLDKRNKPYQTTSGHYFRFIQEIPLYTSNDYSLANGFDYKKYFEPLDGITSAISIFGKMINSLNDEDVRISNRLNLPEKKLRGFESGKIGPVDEGNFVGGNYAMSLNYSTKIPLLPDLQTADFKFFIDAGNVWGIDYSSTIDDSNKIRSSIGIAADWFTPIGPLTFSIANPITKAGTDRVETFRFNIGTSF